MGRAVKVNICQVVFVVLHYFLQVLDSWVENVTIHCEAVSCSLRVWWNTTTEAEQIYPLISVVVLENATNLVDDLKVMVLLHVKVVERFTGSWVPILKSEIDGDGEVDLTAPENVFKERVFLLEH